MGKVEGPASTGGIRDGPAEILEGGVSHALGRDFRLHGTPGSRRPGAVPSATLAAAPRGDGTRRTRRREAGRGGAADKSHIGEASSCRRAIGTAGGSRSHDRRRPRHPVVRFSPPTGLNGTTARGATTVVRYSLPPARQGGRGADLRPRRAAMCHEAAMSCEAAMAAICYKAAICYQAAQLGCSPVRRGQPG
jgi:hypothetical protein